MINSTIQHTFFPFGPYLAQFDMDPEFCKKLLREGRKLKVPYNTRLAGKIEHEKLFDLEKLWIKEGFSPYVNSYLQGYGHFSNIKFNNKWEITSMWINIQKANEFNPIHLHTNCNISFVLWLKIPSKILKEKTVSLSSPPGWTTFIHGEEQLLCVTDRTFGPVENRMMMFNSKLRHEVTPFNTKVERISIAGNIKFL